MSEKPEELNNEFMQAGFPPLPRTDIPFQDDDFNFKKAVITPKEPVEYIPGNDGVTYEVPCYTATMALGNLSTNEVGAERDDFRIARILKRYNYPSLVTQQYYAITDRIIATQSHQATMLAAVTVQQYGMRRIETSSSDKEATEGDSGSPLTKLIGAIKGAPRKGDDLKQRMADTTARYRS